MAGQKMARGGAEKQRLQELHLLCLGALHEKARNLKIWRIYGELKAIKPKPVSAAWLEATIATLALGRVRPTRAFNLLRRLRDLRLEAGEEAAFERFEALVQTSLAPLRLTQHGYDAHVFGTLDHATVWEQVSHHLAALSGEGYRVFLNSGTLLGVIRDGALIDHDDDIDLALVLRARSASGAAREWRALEDTLRAINLLEDTQDAPEIYRLKPAGKTRIDLFPAWSEHGSFYVYPHTHGTLATADVLPLRICERTGHPLPAKPEAMLAVNFGPGWSVPDPLFKFPWAEANTQFAPFLEALRA